MEKKQTVVLRKEIQREIKGNEEIIVNDFHKIPLPCDYDDISVVMDSYDDFESQYQMGIYSYYNDDLYSIDVDKLLDFIKDWFEGVDEDDKESILYETFTRLQKDLKDWKEYTMYF